MTLPQTAQRRTIVFVEQYYYPEGWGGAQLPRDITIALAAQGYDVEVICGSDQYAPMEGGSIIPNPAHHGVRIRKVARWVSGDIHRLKLLRQLWFYIASAPMLFLRRSPSVYVTQTNPPLIIWLVAVAARIHNCPFIIVAQDLYPEVILAHRMLKAEGAGARLLQKIFRWAYRRASIVVSLGPTMSERLEAKGVQKSRIRCISNWATGEEHVVRGEQNVLRAAWGLENKTVILYSGNLGNAHDIETPLRAFVDAHAEHPELRLVFVGKGTRLAEAQALAGQLNIAPAVQFHPLVPMDLLPHSLGLADVALVTLRSGFEGLVVPSKLLGYMARGVPTIYVGPPSDVQIVIDEAGGGICIESGRTREASDAFIKLAADPGTRAAMGAAARRYYNAKLARDVGLGAYIEVIHSTERQCSDAFVG